MTAAFDPIRAALLVMLHEAQRWNAAVLRDAGIGPFDLGAIRQAEAALRTASAEPTPEVNVEALTDEALLALWPNVRYDFSEGREDILEFGRAALAAQADARRGPLSEKEVDKLVYANREAEGTTMDFVRLVEAAIGAKADARREDGAMLEQIGVVNSRAPVTGVVWFNTPPGELPQGTKIFAAMNTTKGADHAE